ERPELGGARANLPGESRVLAIRADHQACVHGNGITSAVDSTNSLDYTLFHDRLAKRGAIAHLSTRLLCFIHEKLVQKIAARTAVSHGDSAAVSMESAEARFQVDQRHRATQADVLYTHFQSGEMRRLFQDGPGYTPPIKIGNAARPDEVRGECVAGEFMPVNQQHLVSRPGEQHGSGSSSYARTDYNHIE